jgi:ribosomal protein S11
MSDDHPTDNRNALIHAVAHGLLFEVRKRTHHADRMMAEIAARKVVEHLLRCGYVIRRGPGLPHHTAPDPDVGSAAEGS